MQPESFNVHFTVATEVLQTLTGGLATLPQEQWLLAAIDVVKGERRVFAVSDIQDWVIATPKKG